MKNSKFLLMVAMMLGLSLTACGGNKPSAEPSKAPSSQTPSAEPSSAAPSSAAPSSAAPSSAAPSSAKPSSAAPSSAAPSSAAPSSAAPSSEAPAGKAVTVTSVNLVAKESKVYLQLVGAAQNYTAAEFKWALALQHAGAADSGDASEDFVLGTSAEFVDADYKLDATLNDDGSYLFEYNLSDIEGIGPGLLTIHAGVKGLTENLAVGTVNNAATLKDNANRYYIRADVNNRNTIAIDALPPVALEEASIVTDDDGVIWAKIGGTAAGSITQEVLDGYDSFIQFQSTITWGNTKRSKADGQYYWKLEGTKAYIYADISFFTGSFDNESSGRTTHYDHNAYNTHLNVTANSQADCKMDAAINEHYVVKNAAGNYIDINVFAKPGASEQAEFWGNLGFTVYDAAEYDSAAFKASLTAGADNSEKDFGNGIKGYKWNKTAVSSTLSYTALSATKAATEQAAGLKATLSLLISVKDSNKAKTQFWKQITDEPEGGTDKTSIKVNDVEVAHGQEPDFATLCNQRSTVSDNGTLTVPVWVDVADIDLTVDAENPNSIVISYLGGGYSYYICGARIVYSEAAKLPAPETPAE